MSNNESNDTLLKIHLSEHESKYVKFKKKIKNTLFNLFFLLLKDNKSNILLECISLIIQYIQLLYFPFDSYVNKNILIFNFYSLMLNGKRKNVIKK